MPEKGSDFSSMPLKIIKALVLDTVFTAVSVHKVCSEHAHKLEPFQRLRLGGTSLSFVDCNGTRYLAVQGSYISCCAKAKVQVT